MTFQCHNVVENVWYTSIDITNIILILKLKRKDLIGVPAPSMREVSAAAAAARARAARPQCVAIANSAPTPAMTDLEPVFVGALSRPPGTRSLQDLQVIYYGLSGLEALATLRDSALRQLCKVVRYERHQANDVLY